MKSRSRRAGIGALLLLLLTGCGDSVKKDFVVATGPQGTTNYELGNVIVETFNDGLRYRVRPDTAVSGSLARAKALQDGKVDFAMVQNDIVLTEENSRDLRTVLPLYPQVLFIIYKPGIEAKMLPELLKGRRVGVGPRNSGVQAFIKRLCREFQVDTSACTFVYTAYEQNILGDSIDISCSLIGFNNPRINDMIGQGGRIWAFDSVDQLGRGASVEGFCMKYPYAQPYVLPRRLYGAYPAEPMLTLAVNNILVASARTDDVVVYDFVQYLLTHKEQLVNRNVLFTALPVDETQAPSRFPLHNGVRKYYERDRPTFFERHADLLGLLIALLTIIGSAFFGIHQLRRQLSERRLDKYRFKLLDLQRKLEFTYDLPTLLELEKNLRQLWKDLIEAARQHRVRVDKEFETLRNMLKETEDELHNKRMEAEREDEG
jgi:TRAP transporter TAXI family solute receptor